jgi:alcohol dehydrogenase class IV
MEGPACMNWLNDFQFGPMSRVVFGNGRAREAGQIARELSGTSALVMTDPTLHRLGLTETIEASLKDAGVRCEVFNGVPLSPLWPQSRQPSTWSANARAT